MCRDFQADARRLLPSCPVTIRRRYGSAEIEMQCLSSHLPFLQDIGVDAERGVGPCQYPRLLDAMYRIGYTVPQEVQLADDLKKLPARFYRSETGTEPVREWLASLSKADRRIIGVDIATVEYGWPVGMPTCRPLGRGYGR